MGAQGVIFDANAICSGTPGSGVAGISWPTGVWRRLSRLRSLASQDPAYAVGLSHRTAQDAAGQSASPVGRCSFRFGGQDRRPERGGRHPHRYGQGRRVRTATHAAGRRGTFGQDGRPWMQDAARAALIGAVEVAAWGAAATRHAGSWQAESPRLKTPATALSEPEGIPVFTPSVAAFSLSQGVYGEMVLVRLRCNQ